METHMIKNIEKILRIMEKEARKRNAPVFRFENKNGKTSFRILVATLLSSRTKDEKTIEATERLFSKINNPRELIKLKEKQIEKIIYGVGFHKTKAKNLKKLSKILLEEFKGKVPNSLEELIKLPGVGRKTANIVLSIAFGKYTLGVDTHVHRISNRFRWVRTNAPERTELELIKKIPKRFIRKLNKILVAYGQTVCTPTNPKCKECKLNKICPRIGVN